MSFHYREFLINFSRGQLVSLTEVPLKSYVIMFEQVVREWHYSTMQDGKLCINMWLVDVLVVVAGSRLLLCIIVVGLDGKWSRGQKLVFRFIAACLSI